MAARDMADRVGHRQYRETERQRDAKKADPERGKCSGQNGAAAAAEGQPECAKELSPGTDVTDILMFQREVWHSYSPSADGYVALS